jgi:selenium metabolism protein YedF
MSTEPETDRSPRSGTVVLIASDRLGSGSDDLGWVIMRVFVKTLHDVTPRPDAIILLNAGVKLATEGSELIGPLSELARDGSEVLACGTCLDYFELRDQLRVGRVTNMLEIVTKLSTADRVIRP